MAQLSKKGLTEKQADELYLKLDQTIRQYVIKGIPQFNEGITIRKNKPLFYDGE